MPKSMVNMIAAVLIGTLAAEFIAAKTPVGKLIS
jgi:hypothetical protein